MDFTAGNRGSVRQEIPAVLSEESDDSLVENETPSKIRRITMPAQSRGIAHVTPRRSSIVVSPSKSAMKSTGIATHSSQTSQTTQTSQTLPTSQPSRLSAQERMQRLQFYMKQIPKGLEAIPESEIQTHVKSLLSQTVQEIKETQESLNDQLMTADPSRRELIDFLLVVTNDIIAELETIRPAENRRMSLREESMRTPVKSPRHGVSVAVSSNKPVSSSKEDKSDASQQVLQAIEKNPTLSYEVRAKQIILFDRVVSCVQSCWNGMSCRFESVFPPWMQKRSLLCWISREFATCGPRTEIVFSFSIFVFVC